MGVRDGVSQSKRVYLRLILYGISVGMLVLRWAYFDN